MNPPDQSRITKMRIPLEESDEHGICGESLWVTVLGNDNYRIENHPLAEGLFYRDVVKAFDVDGTLTFDRLVLRLVGDSAS